MQNVEIELRFILSNENVLLDWLTNKATLVKNGYQYDIYYQQDIAPFIHKNDDGVYDANEWLRIRIMNDNNDGLLCYKKWHRDSLTGKPLYADEIEIKIEDTENLKLLLCNLNYSVISEIKRYRKSWKFQDYFIERDEIEELGIFYEIEYIGQTQSPQYGERAIRSLIEEIGIHEYKVIDRGYPWMYWNPNWKNLLGMK